MIFPHIIGALKFSIAVGDKGFQMASNVGNSVSCPEYEETREEYSNKFHDVLNRWQNQDSSTEAQEYNFDSTLGFWKNHDTKRRRAKAPHRHSIPKKGINQIKADASLPPHHVMEFEHDHEHHHYSPESPCEFIPPARPLPEVVPCLMDEEVYTDDEEVQEEQSKSHWNWTSAAIIGCITLVAIIGILMVYNYTMVYYSPEEEEDCNCINDGMWKFVTRTLFNMKQPQQVRKPFL